MLCRIDSLKYHAILKVDAINAILRAPCQYGHAQKIAPRKQEQITDSIGETVLCRCAIVFFRTTEDFFTKQG